MAVASKTRILEENWKRALADYQNLLRRVEADKTQFAKFANANLIARLLPSLDVIEMAASHSQDLGVQMAAKQFDQALKDEGLAVINPSLGDSFDPREHDCTETVSPQPSAVTDTIAEVVLKGYRLGELVLRPARVKVFKTST
jgi:molecular chaperone GrpE